MLMSPPSDVCETLENTCAMAVQHVSRFDMSLGYMAYCRSFEVNWPRCTLPWVPYVFTIGKLSDAPSCSTFSTRPRNTDGEPFSDLIVPASVLFVPEDFTPFPTIQAQVRRWLSDHQLSDIPGSEVPSEIPEVGIFDEYAAEIECEGN